VRGITRLGEDLAYQGLYIYCSKSVRGGSGTRLSGFRLGSSRINIVLTPYTYFVLLGNINFQRTVILIGCCEEFFFMEIGNVCIAS
jgi:hypothetical protein